MPGKATKGLPAVPGALEVSCKRQIRGDLAAASLLRHIKMA
jgi:hypothetical protein